MLISPLLLHSYWSIRYFWGNQSLERVDSWRGWRWTTEAFAVCSLTRDSSVCHTFIDLTCSAGPYFRHIGEKHNLLVPPFYHSTAKFLTPVIPLRSFSPEKSLSKSDIPCGYDCPGAWKKFDEKGGWRSCVPLRHWIPFLSITNDPNRRIFSVNRWRTNR